MCARGARRSLAGEVGEEGLPVPLYHWVAVSICHKDRTAHKVPCPSLLAQGRACSSLPSYYQPPRRGPSLPQMQQPCASDLGLGIDIMLRE